MAARDSFRRIANRCRAIPGQFGLRPWRVYLDTSSWSGPTHAGDGTESTTAVELLESGQPPKAREASSKAVALGYAEAGQWTVGPITPVLGASWSALLASAVTTGQTFRVRLVHDETGDQIDLAVTKTTYDRALRYELTGIAVR
jgi:hypothetical protein